MSHRDEIGDLYQNSRSYEIRQSSKDLIYFAAKDGHPIGLIAALNDIEDPETRNTVINDLYVEDDGQTFTPLAVAANLGRYTVVKALLTKYEIDLEKECIAKFDGHIVHGATALWCAAGAGHLNIVKLLIKYGANMNHKTKAHSTPLRAACFEGRLDIVRYLILHGADVQLANTYNNTCLMISAYKGHTDIVEYLLISGSDPNKQALCGATALHYAAECGHLEICDLLLEYDAKILPNEYGLSPVLTAAERTNEHIVEMFFSKPGLLTKQEKIDACELMGASFANDKDNYSIERAYKYLMLGMQLRYEDQNNVIKKTMNIPIPAYDNWIESQTIQDLQAIRLNNNSIHMESLAIRERLLGKRHPDLPQHIVFRGAIYADQSRFDRCESLWLYAMELRQNNNISIERDMLRFAQLYSQILHIGIPLRLSSVLSVLASCIKELNSNRQKTRQPGPKDDVEVIAEEFEQNFLTTLYIITITAKLLKSQQTIQKNDLNNLMQLIYNVNKMDIRLRGGQTLLHMAVNGVAPVDDFHTSDVCRFPCVDTVKLLLHCGAQINATDCDRNTPLHMLALTVRSFDRQTITTVESIMQLFIEAGIHLDAVNKNGLTASELGKLHVVGYLIKRHELRLTTLKCLSARCIASNKIPYTGQIPQDLEPFIYMHNAEKL